MMSRSIASATLFISLFLSTALTQVKKAGFDGQAAYEYDKVLASDAMQGRMSGEPGGQASSEYIVSKLREWGLEPAGPNGSYFQDMTYEYCR